jgi:hypothetical protein
MLTASARIHPGIHQRRPATLPSLRIAKVSLSLSTRPANSLVVVIQVLPMMGNTLHDRAGSSKFCKRFGRIARVVLADRVSFIYQR